MTDTTWTNVEFVMRWGNLSGTWAETWNNFNTEWTMGQGLSWNNFDKPWTAVDVTWGAL